MIDYAVGVLNPHLSKSVPVDITYMTRRHAQYWDKEIQPRIRRFVDDSKQKHREQNLPDPPPDRADYRWNWPKYFEYLPKMRFLLNSRCRALTVLLPIDARNAQEVRDPVLIPAGMILLIESYPWLFPRAWRRKSTYTWFLATAPRSVLQELGVSNPPPLGALMVDTALVTSRKLGHRGRMWLHAAPKGGRSLFDFYRNKCSMSHVPIGFPLPLGFRSDGRHFYAIQMVAKRLLDRFDKFRPGTL